MVIDLITNLVTAKGKSKEAMFQSGYYGLGGFLSAIIIHDLWRMYGLPGGMQTFRLGDKDTGIRMDQIYQIALGAIPAIMELVSGGKFKHGWESFAGYGLGIGWLNKSELGQLISNV